jgi:hypothetical protein
MLIFYPSWSNQGQLRQFFSNQRKDDHLLFFQCVHHDQFLRTFGSFTARPATSWWATTYLCSLSLTGARAMIARLSSSSARLIRLPPWPRLPAPHDDALTAGHRTWCGAGMTSTRRCWSCASCRPRSVVLVTFRSETLTICSIVPCDMTLGLRRIVQRAILFVGADRTTGVSALNNV